MRKLLILFALLPFMALSSSAQSTKKGDVNEDEAVDISDVVELVNIILNGSGGQSYLNCPDNHHPHMIDLGLPSETKWACCNVGATAPEGNGGYYAWGETEEKEVYDWSTYIHCDGTSSTCHDLGSDISGTEYDVAHVKWGGNWCMPTLDDINELINNCTSEWTTLNGVNGTKFTSNINGNSIFLPATGTYWPSGLNGAGKNSDYWSSTVGDSGPDYASKLYFESGGGLLVDVIRYVGQSVRPVVRN